MRRWRSTRRAAALALLLWSCGAPAQTAAPALPAALAPEEMRRQIASGVRHGVLYEARRGEQRIVLFGTAHLGRPDVFPLDAKAFAELQACKAVVVELDIRKSESLGAAMLEHARLPDGKTLETISTPEQWQRIRSALQARGALNDMVLRSEPWIASSTLVILEASQRGDTMQTGADLVTIALAQAFGKPVLELESAESQADVLGASALDVQVDSLMYTISQLESGDGANEILGIVGAWVAADADKLARYRRDMQDEARPGAKEMYAALLLDREAEMAERIESFRQQYGALFIAIGALHLVGEDSLLARLKQAGYEINRL